MVTERPTATRTVLLFLLVACGAAALVSVTHEFSRDRIAANERQRVIERLRSVVETLPNADRLTPLDVRPPPGESPAATPSDAFVMVERTTPSAVVFAVTAPEGYNAPIQLLVGIDLDGNVTGVRVVNHRETPGLGDAIEREKSDWIEQFTGTTLSMPNVWAVDKDGGPFDSITGATVTPRAVVAAVHRALEYFEMHGAAVIAQGRQRAAQASADE